MAKPSVKRLKKKPSHQADPVGISGPKLKGTVFLSNVLRI